METALTGVVPWICYSRQTVSRELQYRLLPRAGLHNTKADIGKWAQWAWEPVRLPALTRKQPFEKLKVTALALSFDRLNSSSHLLKSCHWIDRR